jgi:oligoendopeptidase F
MTIFSELLGDQTYTFVNVGSTMIVSTATMTANNVAIASATGTGFQSGNIAINYGVTPASYTLSTMVNMYQKLFSDQSARVSTFIYDNLQQLDRSDDEYNEKIIERIAEAIDLVGEPASCVAALDAKVLREDHFVFANLLLAIASSRHRDSESYRLEVLRAFAQNDDPQTRRAAIRALGRMPSREAKDALREISKQAGGRSELAQLSAALAR